MIKNCLNCKQVFNKKSNCSLTSWGKKKYCSKKCSDLFTLYKQGRNNPNKGKKRPEFSGDKHPFYGKHHTKEAIENNKQKHLGKKHTQIQKDKMSIIAKEKGFGKWMIGKTPSVETRKKISESESGSKHYNWQGGISKLPYSIDWTKTLKRSIRERDNYVCQICSKIQEDVTHDVHHIDYNKENCNPINLITLCKSCHMKTNMNRDYWINYFNQS